MFSEALLEEEVKAGFILNFIRFTEFPSAKSEIRLCIAGGGSLYEVFQKLEGKDVGGALLKVEQLSHSEVRPACDVVFIPRATAAGEDQILARFAGQPVLTVGETPQFLSDGGIINFYPENSKLRFEISLNALEKSGLHLSSKLLSLARLITN